MGKRKKREEEHENHERWLVSYADFITLLFAFFVTLYAISQVDVKKMGAFVESMQTALNQNVKMMEHSQPSLYDRKSAVISPVAMREAERSMQDKLRMEKLRQDIEKKISHSHAKNSLSVALDRRGVVLTIKDTILFDSGSAVIRKDAVPVLNEIIPVLANIPNQVRIEGHTDNTPINNERFHSNWELSTARATSIIQYFTEKYRFSPQKLSAAGYGEYRPVKPNDTGSDKAANRRVDIVILNADTGMKEPGKQQLPS